MISIKSSPERISEMDHITPNQEHQLEAQHLAITLKKYNQAICESEERLSAMPGLYKDDPDLLVEMMVNVNNRIVYLRRGLSKPYFARIDFTDDSSSNREALYIGKLGVSDEDDQIVTVDWRAPISSLYYDSNVGPVTYEAPQGFIHGSMDLKRQFEIENSVFLSFRDVDTVSNDDLLKPYLGVNADNRLKNIVASIQGEQNRIIREKLEKNLIVQGAAGSGKTTVALHRIAYLVYNYRDIIKSEQYMVIGPNQFFIQYISSILPDLDVSSVPETTFESFALDYLKESFQVTDPSLQLIKAVNDGLDDNIDFFKGSMQYKESIDRYLNIMEKTIIPQSDFLVNGFMVLNRQDIVDLYDSLEDAFYPTFQAKVNKCIVTFSTSIQNNLDILLSRLSSCYQEKYAEISDPTKIAELHKLSATIQKELENGCKKSLKKYFSAVDSKLLTLYKKFIDECKNYLPKNFLFTEKLKKETLQSLRKRILSFEDLPALIYLKWRLKGSGEYRKFRHAIIDEAQDFGEFHFYALRKVMDECTFTIVGDLAQSIYQYRSIPSWECVIENSFESNAIMLGMEKSYRTTVEIMQAANLVTNELKMPNAIPVIRHGENVHTINISSETQIDLIAQLLNEYKNKEFKSVAIIAKTADEAKDIHSRLKAIEIDCDEISSSSQEYRGGICVITGYLSKGLEFDGVILADASSEKYSPDNKLDLHLLYVSMTRPLHQLDILFIGEIAPPLKPLFGIVE